MKKLSFVIPCYRSENTIEKVINEISEVLSLREEYEYEIICVNDCSPDSVLQVLKRVASSNNHVKVVDFMQNSGKDAALLAGLSFATGDIAITLDDDCQCPTNEVYRLIEPIESSEYDVSTAIYSVKKESAFKRFGSKVNQWMAQMMLNQPKDLRFENFVAISKAVYTEMLNYNNPYPYVEGLMLRVTRRVASVPMEERDRGDDNSTGFTFKKSLSLFINGLTAFSVKPLRVATFIGFITAAIGLIYMLFTIIFYFVSPNTIAEGYSSLLSVILFIGGMLMIMIGMVGEYIGRIYICINRTPQYVVRKTYNIED